MQFIRFYACDQVSGATLPGASVAVYLKATTTLASLFGQAGDVLANPVIADNQGRVGYAAANGDYDVVITSGGEAQPSTRQYLFDPADPAASTSSVPGDAIVGDSGETMAETLSVLADVSAAAAALLGQVNSIEANVLGLTTTVDYQVQDMTLLGYQTSDGLGFILNSSGIYVGPDGLTLSSQITELAAATGAVSANLTENYATTTSVDDAVALAQTALSSQISGVSSTLTTDYLTSAQTTEAISAAQLVLQDNIDGVSSNLSTNYLTSASTTEALSALQVLLQTSINGVSATVEEQGGALTTVQGKTEAYFSLSVDAGTGAASVTIASDGVTGAILLTGNVEIDGNLTVDGSLSNAKLGASAVTADYYGFVASTQSVTPVGGSTTTYTPPGSGSGGGSVGGGGHGGETP